MWISSAAQPTAIPRSSGAPVARAARTASSGRSRLPPAASRWAPTSGMGPMGLSIRSARRASTASISARTSAQASASAPRAGGAGARGVGLMSFMGRMNYSKQIEFAQAPNGGPRERL